MNLVMCHFSLLLTNDILNVLDTQAIYSVEIFILEKYTKRKICIYIYISTCKVPLSTSEQRFLPIIYKIHSLEWKHDVMSNGRRVLSLEKPGGES